LSDKKRNTPNTYLFKCPLDGKEFHVFADLQSHYTSRHARGVNTVSAEKFVCPYDRLEFDTLTNLKLHVTAKHRQVLGVTEPAFEPEETFIKDVGINNSIEPSAVDVKNGKIVRIRPLHLEETGYTKEELTPAMWKFEIEGKTYETPLKTMPPYLTHGYKKRVYSPNRVKYPLKRIDWNPDGERNPQNRGKSKFKRITWDEATTIIAGELRRVKEKYGPYAVLCIGEEGHHESKTVHAASGCHKRLLSKFGGYTREVRNPDSWEGWYWGAKHLWGDGWVGEPTPSPTFTDVMKFTKMIVWGGDWETTTGGAHGRMCSQVMWWFTGAGIKQIFVTPDLNYSAAVHADKWIPVMPGTDAALQLAVIYTWMTEGTYDKEYVATHVIGFDKFSDYVLGKEDRIAKTPAWASKKCGVPAWTIKALAAVWASRITSIGMEGGNFMRGPYGHETARLAGIQLGMQGLGKPGVGKISIQFPRHSVNINVSAAQRAINFDPTPQQIPRTQVQHAILDGSCSSWGSTGFMMPLEDQFVKYSYPIAKENGGTEIHMIWSEKPCNTACWNDGFNFIEAVRSPKIECFITNHPWLENDSLFADIILPVTTKFEETDIGCPRSGAAGQRPILSYQAQAIQPVGESKSDYDIACEIAKKLGIYEELTEGKTVDEWIKYGYETSGVKELISWEKLKEKGFYIPPVAANWKEATSGQIKFYRDPVKNPMGTPSGKLEFYSARLAEKFPDDKERNPVPKWVAGGPGWTHDERLEGERARKYPLILVSNHPRWRQHVQCDDIPWLREISTCKIRGDDGYLYEPVWINPADAGKRGIKHGDIVKMYNERGVVLGGAYVTERIKPGAVSQDHGARIDLITDGIDRGGSNNLISPAGPQSKNCWGQATTAFLVEVKKVTKGEMREWRKKYPSAFERDYDPESGLKYSSWVEE
jgi:molybdopterin guanine dinucleotide-containing S/N-oxide reductase-like protein